MPVLYRFFRSIKLAIVLILLIAALSILATLIPQGREAAFYAHTYPPALARTVLALGLHRFFRSVVFLAPVALFFVSLSVCAVDRLVARGRRKARRRHGPDLIHLGLLLLIAGSMFSVFGRREAMMYLGLDEEIQLPGGYTLRLLSFELLTYDDGRPKDWISTVELSRAGEELLAAFPIEVNRPLKVGRVKVYQTSWADEATAILADAAGREYRIASGQGFRWEGRLLLFQGIEGDDAGGDAGRAVFEEWDQHERRGVHPVSRGEQIAGYRLQSLATRRLTGLMAVHDPGFLPVVIALAVVAAGLALTLLQKRQDLEGKENQ